MILLDAVNLILPKLGERPVTSLEVAHPTLAIILPLVEQVQRDTLLSGWWFNEYAYTAPLNSDGEIVLGVDTMKFVPKYPDTAVLRGKRLFNPKTLLYKFDAPVEGRVTQWVKFDELPESAASYVFHSALVNAYITDLGVTSEVQLWQALAGQAYSAMLAEHLQQRKYSTRRSRHFRGIVNALRS